MCSLGLWVCEELMQKNIHQQVKEAISVLGVTLKVSNPPQKGNPHLLLFDNLHKSTNTLLCQLFKTFNKSAPM